MLGYCLKCRVYEQEFGECWSKGIKGSRRKSSALGYCSRLSLVHWKSCFFPFSLTTPSGPNAQLQTWCQQGCLPGGCDARPINVTIRGKDPEECLWVSPCSRAGSLILDNGLFIKLVVKKPPWSTSRAFSAPVPVLWFSWSSCCSGMGRRKKKKGRNNNWCIVFHYCICLNFKRLSCFHCTNPMWIKGLFPLSLAVATNRQHHACTNNRKYAHGKVTAVHFSHLDTSSSSQTQNKKPASSPRATHSAGTGRAAATASTKSSSRA